MLSILGGIRSLTWSEITWLIFVGLGVGVLMYFANR